jgi:hypothetical protein
MGNAAIRPQSLDIPHNGEDKLAAHSDERQNVGHGIGKPGDAQHCSSGSVSPLGPGR